MSQDDCGSGRIEPLHPQRVMAAASADKVAFARERRREPTRAEKRLWQSLRGGALGVKFRRQHPISDFVLDFYCEGASLAVEMDGPEHAERRKYDRWRDGVLASYGIRTLRLAACDVERDLAGAVRAIRAALDASPPAPLRNGEG